ncbi:MAG: BtrH N-terminal domain-containing protein [Candidatus Stahlbacteria bacterium]|nr:BtrH N-terminal domain-containing protein [Candidatus Stahlbacteria bacterium]
MAEKIKIEEFSGFGGLHCETSALKKVLDYHQLHLSEELLLGIGGGVGFVYWYMKQMPAPFIGTRYGKKSNFLATICNRLGIGVEVYETSSSKKGYEELKKLLRLNEPVICYGDIVYLPYFAVPEAAHFGGHAFVVFGLEEEKVYISDRCNTPVTISVLDLERARNSCFPPFAPKNRLLKLKYPSKIDNLETGIRAGIRDCCDNMLHPPIKNIGLAGMQKWATLILKWDKQFKGLELFGCLLNAFIYIETGGTGGSGFRKMYAQFLRESIPIINKPELREVAEMVDESANIWSKIAKGVLPDTYPILKEVRELILEKNRYFESGGTDALDKMQKLNEAENKLMNKAVENLSPPLTFLADVRNDILKCYEIEKKVFERLNKII